MTDSLFLVVRQPKFPDVVLRLSTKPFEMTDDLLDEDRPGLRANTTAAFRVTGLGPSDRAVTLKLDDHPIAGGTDPICGEIDLEFGHDHFPFGNVIGLANLTLFVASGWQDHREYYVEPFQVLLPPGPAADNLKGMGKEIAQSSALLFGGDDVSVRLDQSLTNRLQLLEDAATLYEKQYPYFREAPIRILRPVYERRSVENLRALTPTAARWIANHPWELQQVPNGGGIRAYGRSWMPRHTPVRSSVAVSDTVENRIITDFCTTMAAEALALGKRLNAGLLEEEAHNPDDLVSSLTLASPVDDAPYRRAAETCAQLAARLSRLARLYADALGVVTAPLTALPPATAHFLETPQYRLVYQLMRRWFDMRDEPVACTVKRLTSIKNARLYEYFLLVRFLKGFLALGFTLQEAFSHQYSGNYHYADEDAAFLNTFTFVRGDETIRIWYQPVVEGPNYSGENGLRLFRSTSWGILIDDDSGDVSVDVSRQPRYTPDYAVSYQRAGHPAVWLMTDAKYSTVRTVIQRYTLTLSFKYLLSVSTALPEERLAGLWIFCGRYSADETQEGSIFDVAQRFGRSEQPDLRVYRYNALEENQREPAEIVLEALQNTLVGLDPQAMR